MGQNGYTKAKLQQGHKHGTDRLCQDKIATETQPWAKQTAKTKLQQGHNYGPEWLC